jgi:hypothetical protein
MRHVALEVLADLQQFGYGEHVPVAGVNADDSDDLLVLKHQHATGAAVIGHDLFADYPLAPLWVGQAPDVGSVGIGRNLVHGRQRICKNRLPECQMNDARILRLKVQIRQRLEGVCCQFPADEFDALIERMAELEIKYTQRREDLRREVPREAILDQHVQERGR